MSTGPNPSRLKDFDFDNIFEDKKDPQPMFDSFRQTIEKDDKVLTSNVVDEDMGQPASLAQSQKKRSTFHSSRMSNSKPLSHVKDKVFDEFGFGQPAPQNSANVQTSLPQNDPFSLPNDGDVSGSLQQSNSQPGNELDIDLMALDLDKGILKQDIQNMEQNLFKKQLPGNDALQSNVHNETSSPNQQETSPPKVVNLQFD